MLIINCYNFIVGGGVVGLKRFVFPIGNAEFIDSLRLRLPNVYHLYVVQIMISLLALGNVFLCRTASMSDNQRAMHLIRISCAVSGLCSLIYFMNRTAYSNILVSFAQLVLLLALFGDESFVRWKILLLRKKQILKRISLNFIISVLCFCLLSALAFESVLGFNNAFAYRMDSTWKFDSLRELENFTKEQVPKNTFAYGIGVPELYFNLGWKTKLHITDWSDMNAKNYEFVEEQKKKQNLIFTDRPVDSQEWIEKAGWNNYKLYVRKLEYNKD